MTFNEAKFACMSRLKKKGIQLGNDYTKPLDIKTNSITRNWIGFIKMHLNNPLQDGLAPLRGERAFAMIMENGIPVIGKIEKRLELAADACNMRLHVKGEMLRGETIHNVFKTVVRESYCDMFQHKFLTLTKLEDMKDFTFLTLAMEEAMDALLQGGIAYNHEKLKVSVLRDKHSRNPSHLGMLYHIGS